jgi:hypothetical protein
VANRVKTPTKPRKGEPEPRKGRRKQGPEEKEKGAAGGAARA